MRILIIDAHDVNIALINAIKAKLAEKENIEVVDAHAEIVETPQITLPIKPYIIEAMPRIPELFVPIEKKSYTNGQTYRHKKRK